MNILFLSPFGSMFAHSIPEAIIAWHAQKKAGSVRMMGCNGIMADRCILDHTNPTAPKIAKTKTCKKCIASQKLICKSFQLKRTTIEDWVQKDEEKQLKDWIYKQKIETLLNLKEFEVSFGNYALYEEMLQVKTADTHYFFQSDTRKKQYKSNVFSCLVALHAFKRYTEHNKTDAFIAYNGLYGINKTTSELAKLKGIDVFSLHAGNNFSNRINKMMVCLGDQEDHIKHVLSSWDKFRKKPISPKDVDSVFSHLKTVIHGKTFLKFGSGYENNGKNIRDIFNIGPNQKILLATLSSNDERIAAERQGHPNPAIGNVFKDQTEWVRWLIRFAKKNRQLFLIIRPHPREYSNRRSFHISQHLFAIEQLFNDSPDNCVLNVPSQEISLHNIALEAPVILNNFSTAGTELALFGLPVVVFDKNAQSYPTDWAYVANSKLEYKELIQHALEKPFAINRSIMASRWLNLDHNYATYDLSGWHLDQLEGKSYRSATERITKLFFILSIITKTHPKLIRKYAADITTKQIFKQLSNSLNSALDTKTIEDEHSPDIETIAVKSSLAKVIAEMDPMGASPMSLLINKL